MIYDEIVNEYDFSPEIERDTEPATRLHKDWTWYPWDDLFGGRLRILRQVDIPIEDGS